MSIPSTLYISPKPWILAEVEVDFCAFNKSYFSQFFSRHQIAGQTESISSLKGSRPDSDKYLDVNSSDHNFLLNT
jgi:hypothetical protein